MMYLAVHNLSNNTPSSKPDIFFSALLNTFTAIFIEIPFFSYVTYLSTRYLLSITVTPMTMLCVSILCTFARRILTGKKEVNEYQVQPLNNKNKNDLEFIYTNNSCLIRPYEISNQNSNRLRQNNTRFTNNHRYHIHNNQAFKDNNRSSLQSNQHFTYSNQSQHQSNPYINPRDQYKTIETSEYKQERNESVHQPYSCFLILKELMNQYPKIYAELSTNANYNLICPITRELINNPVQTVDGVTYEKKAILTWFKTSNRSPMTSLEIDKAIVPDKNYINKLTHIIKNEIKLSEKNNTGRQYL
ncbi:MAG: U-box domain-containing protein [Pseudomonadota bacterium]|nr:U-box domain-containing protein [Pseudomonadota bacterium]